MLCSSNVNVPPIRTGNDDDRQQQFDPSVWPHDRDTFICGDINGHRYSRDALYVKDERGKVVNDSALGKDFTTANNALTRHWVVAGEDRQPISQQTIPDVTLHKLHWLTRIKWTVWTELSSDHLSIIFIIHTNQFQCTERAKRAKTSQMYKKGNWNKFRHSFCRAIRKRAHMEWYN